MKGCPLFLPPALIFLSCLARRKASQPCAIAVVVSRGTPFKIADMIVQLVFVLVVHLWQTVWVRNERFGDKSMNEFAVLNVSYSLVKAYTVISILINSH